MKSYVFYKDRPEWADVTPVPQDEGDKCVIKIAYSPEFVDANDYMRAVLLKDERSSRALDVTSTVLKLNAANYTVWEYRRNILSSLGLNLLDELQFVDRLTNEQSKNYQLWHHRQWIVTQLTEKPHLTDIQSLTSDELSFIEQLLAEDSKHYHAWQYRRWLVGYLKIPVESELAFTEKLIRQDVYNNSAWNHRFVTATKDEGLTPPVLAREIEFSQNRIREAPNNDSSWNYLYGLTVPTPIVVAAGKRAVQSQPTPPLPDSPSLNTCRETTDGNHPQETTQLVIHPPSSTNLRMMRSFAEDLATSDAVAADSVALLGFLVEVYMDCVQDALRSKGRTVPERVIQEDIICGTVEPMSPIIDSQPIEVDSVTELVELAVSTCERLATELDRIRVTYWRYRSRQIQALVCETIPQS